VPDPTQDKVPVWMTEDEIELARDAFAHVRWCTGEDSGNSWTQEELDQLEGLGKHFTKKVKKVRRKVRGQASG
jgi:hypothetical protein